MLKKIERKGESAHDGKKNVKIINNNGSAKVVKTQRTPRLKYGPLPNTPVPEPRITERVSHWHEVEIVKMNVMIEQAAIDGRKVKVPWYGSPIYSDIM